MSLGTNVVRSLSLFVLNDPVFFAFCRYKGFRVKKPCEELLTFEGDNDVFGLNFSSRDEATGFRHHLDKRYEQEQRTRKCSLSFSFIESTEMMLAFDEYSQACT